MSASPCPAAANRSYGASAGAELAADIAAAEAAIHDALAAALQVSWPVSRWPIYVFTGAAQLACFVKLLNRVCSAEPWSCSEAASEMLFMLV